MMKAPTRVFQVPELIYQISTHLDPIHVVDLLTVSRIFFSAAVPRVWETVLGATSLLQFLPCQISNEIIEIDDLLYSGSFTFENPLSESDFNRFNFYAPYVKHLYLFELENDLKLTYGWDIIVDYAVGHRLLPNLVTLSLEPPRKLSWHILPYPWVLVFLSPTLKSLSIGASLAEFSPRAGSGLCHLLAEQCPNLTALEFHWLPEELESEQDKYFTQQPGEVDHIPDVLRPDSSLQRLSVNVGFANKYILLVSQMHNLRSLKLCDTECWDLIPALTSLSSGSFPTLTEFALEKPDVLMAGSVWEHMPVLFTGLSKLECRFDSTPYCGRHYEPISSFPLRFATMLNDKSPNITDLTIHFNYEDCYITTERLTVDEHTLLMLAKLPLRRLSVESISICIRGSRTTSSMCWLLAHTFPDLEVLRWTSQPANCEDLHAFAGMPNLQYLGLYTIAREGGTKNLALEYLEIRKCPERPLRTLESHIGTGGWLYTVGYIAHIWPSIRIIPPRFQDPFLGKEDSVRVKDRYKFINGFVVLNRDSN
ncbi:hypothetical protein FRC12_013376 [Ceratobasidium sp. 428]|nr:hypothetical protein FRC12_013376 [Ceratobasidium sp. 428]